MTRLLARISAPILGALLAGCGAHTQSTSAGSLIVAQVGERGITSAELDDTVSQELYDLRKGALDQLIAEEAIQQQAARDGIEPEALMEARLAAKIPPVEAEVARQFYDLYGDQLGPEFEGKPFEEVQELIIEGMTAQLREQAVSQVIADLLAEADVHVYLSPPRTPVEAVGFSRGPEDAPIVIVEFSDFECPFCARGRVTMEQVLATYPDTVRLVFRDLPLPFHPNARTAAEAGRCAGDQGQFWKMHDWMFAHQDTLNSEALNAAAPGLGLDADAFALCLEATPFAADVDADLAAAKELGVNGTPAFFVNGIKVSGAQPYDVFKDILDGELARLKSEAE